jgi:DNA-directed RNA polymerase subunit RPC12/RpoP
MKIECAWCGKDLGEKEPLKDQATTHVICEKCFRKFLDELDRGKMESPSLFKA